MIKMIFSGATDKGLVRDNNEDAFICQHLWDDQHVLCVAIDGLGGYEGGEIAAGIAKNTIIDYLDKNRMGDPLDLLKQAVTQANNDIVNFQSHNENCNRMGCVLTTGLFDLKTGRLTVAHVGDSRLYQWHEGNLRKLTHDHSLVGYREDMGELNEEQAMNHPQRNVVERILGDKLHHLEDKGFIEAAIFPLKDGMYFLFCSDGLTDMVTSAEISLIVENNRDDLEKCANALIKSACDHGGRDNVTVVMACYMNDEQESVITNSPQPRAEEAGPHAVENPAIQIPKAQDAEADLEPQKATNNLTLTDTLGEQERGNHRVGPVLLRILALAAGLATCLASFYGGYRMGYGRHQAELIDKVKECDSTITVLQDSLSHQNQIIYDQMIKMEWMERSCLN